MPATEVHAGKAFVDDTTVGAGGTWTNPANAVSRNGVYATNALASGGGFQTYYLKATDFGFAVPADATIVGVSLRVAGLTSLGTRTWECKLVKGGTVSGDNKSTSIPSAVAEKILGGEADMWGLTLTPSDVNASNFGAVVSCLQGDSNGSTESIDSILLAVHYTLPPVYGRGRRRRFRRRL